MSEHLPMVVDLEIEDDWVWRIGKGDTSLLMQITRSPDADLRPAQSGAASTPPRRSSRQTTRMLPLRSISRHFVSPGRSVFAPDSSSIRSPNCFSQHSRHQLQGNKLLFYFAVQPLRDEAIYCVFGFILAVTTDNTLAICHTDVR